MDGIGGGFATIYSENTNLNVEINAIFLPLVAYICRSQVTRALVEGKMADASLKLSTIIGATMFSNSFADIIDTRHCVQWPCCHSTADIC
jgi:hypothetical protein